VHHPTGTPAALSNQLLHAASTQVTYKRLQDTLSALSTPGGGPRPEQLPGLALLDVMFGERAPHFAAAAPKWKAINTRLDASQVRAPTC
jgi:hypothetical protein